MSVTEIIAELPRLNSQELAAVQAKLAELAGSNDVDVRMIPIASIPRLHSPRLADPGKSSDFTKQVMEIAPNGAV